MTIDVFSKQTWETKTAWPGFVWSRIDPVQGQLRYTWQVPAKTDGAPLVEFQVWSSICPVMQQTDPEAGEDSIRLVVSYGDGIYWKWPKAFWITREPGWADRLKDKIAKHLDVIMPRKGKVRVWRRCPDCGGFLLPHPVKRPKAPDKQWYLKCYGKGGSPTKCFETRTKRDGRQGDRRWKSWLQINKEGF